MRQIRVTKILRRLKNRPGYIRDQNDPYLWHQQYPSCSYMTKKRAKSCCGQKSKLAVWCGKFKKFVVLECVSCDHANLPREEEI